ncbi:uncharacterized protein IL334_004184 [Kwoniella shivajii]|uniref:Uncharacterized protein n=1 Tax=Kwoniella shivajii TaxID=564305 RepID=A0ABZ1CZR7_9TREE|nr:hypothetical protein IL334_004184 [Kwoniella shivajii]
MSSSTQPTHDPIIKFAHDNEDETQRLEALKFPFRYLQSQFELLEERLTLLPRSKRGDYEPLLTRSKSSAAALSEQTVAEAKWNEEDQVQLIRQGFEEIGTDGEVIDKILESWKDCAWHPGKQSTESLRRSIVDATDHSTNERAASWKDTLIGEGSILEYFETRDTRYETLKQEFDKLTLAFNCYIEGPLKEKD